MKKVSLLILAAALLIPSAHLLAVTPSIVWGNATTISADSDVRTDGTLVYAYTFGNISDTLSTTVNGVTFSPFVVTLGSNTTLTVGNLTATESPASLWPQSGLNSSSTPFTTLGSQYGYLLTGAMIADNPTTITMTLGGLVNGQQYIVQVWASNSSLTASTFGNSALLGTIIDSGSPYSKLLLTNSTSTVGGVGQFSVGTFTASGTSRTFTLTGNSASMPLINAIQVRAVPEPSTIGFGFAGAAFIGWVIRRRRA